MNRRRFLATLSAGIAGAALAPMLPVTEATGILAVGTGGTGCSEFFAVKGLTLGKNYTWQRTFTFSNNGYRELKRDSIVIYRSNGATK